MCCYFFISARYYNFASMKKTKNNKSETQGYSLEDLCLRARYASRLSDDTLLEKYDAELGMFFSESFSKNDSASATDPKQRAVNNNNNKV